MISNELNELEENIAKLKTIATYEFGEIPDTFSQVQKRALDNCLNYAKAEIEKAKKLSGTLENSLEKWLEG